MAYNDLTMDANGKLLAIINEPSGTRIVRMATTPDAALTPVAQGGFINGSAFQLAVEFDGKILLTDGKNLVRIDPTSGAQSLLHTFASGARGMVVAKDGAIYVRTAPDVAEQEHLQRVDPKTRRRNHRLDRQRIPHQHRSCRWRPTASLSSPTKVGSRVKWSGPTPRLAAQTTLFAFGSAENFDITVVGVPQIGGPPLPKAGNDSFTAEFPATDLHVNAPGLLGNDTDPLGQQFKVETITQTKAGLRLPNLHR